MMTESTTSIRHMLPRIAWPGLHIPVYRHDHSATLAEVLTSLSPVLGGLPGQGTDARHGKHSHSFLTPTSFFLVAYVFILVGLAFKISIRKTAAWRQIALPFSFGIARTIYWSLRSARLAKQPDNPAVHDVHSVVKEDFTMAFWVEQGFLLTASGALLYPIMTLFRDAVASHHTQNCISRWLLKHWGGRAKLALAISVAVGFPIPSLMASALRHLSENPAKWAHWLMFCQAVLHVIVLVVHYIALIAGWCSEPPHTRIDPDLSFQSVDAVSKERAKLFALTILTVTYSVSIWYRFLGLVLLKRVYWINDDGAFYTLFALPEILSLFLFLLLPWKLLVPDPRTLLRIDIPTLGAEEARPEETAPNVAGPTDPGRSRVQASAAQDESTPLTTTIEAPATSHGVGMSQRQVE